MSAIRQIIQRQLFQKDDERIQAIVNVSELDGKKKKNQTLFCLAVTIENPIAVRLYFVKGEKDDTFKKKDRFNLREVTEIDGINPKKPSPEFHITIGDRQYVILADSAEEKEDFIRELYKLSCQYLPVQMPDFCNFSLPQLEAEASIIPIELPVHDIAMQSNYQPVSQKEGSPKNLSDMPIHVVGLIIKRSDYKEQLILRKTSKSLRDLVDQEKPACTRLEVFCMVDFIICKYNEHCFAYVSSDLDDEDIDFMKKNTDYVVDKIISKDNFHQLAFDDLRFTLKNPKLQLEFFSFRDWCSCSHEELENFDHQDDNNGKPDCEYGNMEDVLKSINQQLSVKACQVDISEINHTMSILPYLKPGELERITLSDRKKSIEWCHDSEAMEPVALLDQWKQAKELIMECEFRNDFPVEETSHFKRFQFPNCPDLDDIIFYLWQHENFEFCSVTTSHPARLLEDFIGQPVSPNLWHYTIPDSEIYLEIMADDERVTIVKKKK